MAAEVIAEGTPESVALNPASFTGDYLRHVLAPGGGGRGLISAASVEQKRACVLPSMPVRTISQSN